MVVDTDCDTVNFPFTENGLQDKSHSNYLQILPIMKTLQELLE